MARWSSWGAIPQVFDERGTTAAQGWDVERAKLRELLSDEEWRAARRTTINAHYTDPAYVAQMWALLGRLGYAGGRVLEPGCGVGTFMAMAPAETDMVGVELDPVTAQIAASLNPSQRVRAESFAETRIPNGYFDAVIGNVPFADVTLHDRRHNRASHSMHNHFIVKSLALTRPGGLVAVLTSHWTLDAKNPSARREMNTHADLLGAVRLPSGAHRRAAGTEAVTDLLVFRRRDEGEPPRSVEWETVRPIMLDGGKVSLNNYFAANPDHVLGDLRVGHGMYSNETLQVVGNLEATVSDFADVTGRIADMARESGLEMTDPKTDVDRGVEAVALTPPGTELWDGHITDHADGTFTRVVNGVQEPLAVPKTRQVEVRSLLRMRDLAKDVLEREAASVDDSADLDSARRQLRTLYGAYVDRYGPINRYTLSPTGKVDEETGVPKMRRLTPGAVRVISEDPFGPLVTSLEVFDDATQQASPAALLSQRVVEPRTPVLGVDTVEEALSVCLETNGRPDLPTIARLLGEDETAARERLGELVYANPATGELETAAAYLSGNVREKLAAAEERARDDPDAGWQRNVTALRQALPADIGADQIEPRLGAVWIPTETHRQFLAELLDDDTIQIDHPGGNIWEVKGDKRTVAATGQWGTGRMSAIDIVQSTLEQRTIKVNDLVSTDPRVYALNPEETAAAQEKAQAIQERFAEWVWGEPDRAEHLLTEYNARFNSLVLRDYSNEGTRLTFPGLAKTFTPRDHQRGAVARMLSEPAVGLFHQVGAGKTAEMVLGATELRRLGMVRKPAVVVPNHMLEQFTREWLQLYPQARLLASSAADLRGDKRRQFVARAAAHDWDAVLLTYGAFERIPMSASSQATYIERETEQLREMLANSKRDGGGLAVKRLENKIATAEERLKKVLDGPNDQGISFEQTGIDYLVVDEMHNFKNLHTASNVADPNASIKGSDRATDLHMKTEYLRGRYGGRVITGATATPIANTITEAHVMLRYLRPDLLEAAGVEHFDAWAATFAQTTSDFELAPTGTYRQKTRLAKFQNVPEMLRMWHVFADVKTAEDLGLPTPDIAPDHEGVRRARTTVVKPTPELDAYMADLVQRADDIAKRLVDADVDNMLKITGDGRKAALDLRLVGISDGGNGKLAAAADRIAAIYNDTKDTAYLDEAGEESPTRGALQLVFCDQSTPDKDHWNAYDELRRLLIERGVPETGVRAIHEANNDAEKARMFAAARSGQIAVLLGSTQKMGMGTNVQARAIALHHLDCPWRPADLEQRNGRIVRQGNQNPEVQIHQYVTEKSFDGYNWQTIERKERFIAQIMRGSTDVREIEEIGDGQLNAATVKALGSGEPLVLEKAQADADLAKYERLRRAWERNQTNLSRTIDRSNITVAHIDEQIPVVQAAIDRRMPIAGDDFRMEVDGTAYDERTKAAEALRAWATAHGNEFGTDFKGRDHGIIGKLGGQSIRLRSDPGNLGQPPGLTFHIDGVPHSDTYLEADKVQADTGIGTIRRIENIVAGLDSTVDKLGIDRDHAELEASRARDALGTPFKYQAELDAARARVAEVDDKIAQEAGNTNDREQESVEAGPDTPRRDHLDPIAALNRIQQNEPIKVDEVERSEQEGLTDRASANRDDLARDWT